MTKKFKGSGAKLSKIEKIEMSTEIAGTIAVTLKENGYDIMLVDKVQSILENHLEKKSSDNQLITLLALLYESH